MTGGGRRSRTAQWLTVGKNGRVRTAVAGSRFDRTWRPKPSTIPLDGETRRSPFKSRGHRASCTTPIFTVLRPVVARHLEAHTKGGRRLLCFTNWAGSRINAFNLHSTATSATPPAAPRSPPTAHSAAGPPPRPTARRDRGLTPMPASLSRPIAA